VDSIGIEAIIRLGAFAVFFSAFALWELRAPRRSLSVGRRRRWPGNLGILIVDILTVRVLVPTAAVGASLFAAGNGWGLINHLHLRLSVAALIGFLALDLVIYLQHVIFHKVPVLWRLHRMHHADLDIDVTTGVRFHPIEILISLAIKITVILLLGIPVVAVILFEVVLNVTSMFNHANAAMPAWLDRALRWIVVTPDMHRVHHSVLRRETDSNFGFNLPWWDRLFGTYRAQPEAGHTGMTIGLPIFRNAGELRIDRLLTQPFRNAPPVADPTPESVDRAAH
jgi:sterol desaturase/sphingolipid hydroxylase (fatty acid hydroxylase superfamily)